MLSRSERHRCVIADKARRFGAPAEVIRTETTGDPIAGTLTETTTSTPVQIIPPSQFSVQSIDTSLVQDGDAVVGLPAQNLPLIPGLTDRVRFDDRTRSIVRISPIYSGGVIAMYELQVR